MSKSQSYTLGCLAVLIAGVLLFFVLILTSLGRYEGLLPANPFGDTRLDLVSMLQSSLGWTTSTPTPRPSPTPTSTPTPTRTPTPSPTPTLTPTPTPTWTSTPEPTPTFTRVLPLPTDTPFPAQAEAALGPTQTPQLVEQTYEGAVSEAPVTIGAPYAEAEVLSVQLINEERQRSGMLVLAKDATLDIIAQERSRDMAERGYFSHEDPGGGALPLEKLLLENGVDYLQAGENIAYFLGPTEVDLLPHLSFKKWMDSPGHRDNLLETHYNYTGFGIASTRTGEGTIWYLTQVFVEN